MMEQKNEAVYLLNGETYLHLQENGAGVGFATYNKVTGEPLESGQISEKNLPPDGRKVRLKDCRSAKGKTCNATVLLSTKCDGRSNFTLEFEES